MLSSAEKNVLLRNRVALIKNIYPSEELFSHMMSDHSLTDMMVEDIKVSLDLDLIFFFHLVFRFICL